MYGLREIEIRNYRAAIREGDRLTRGGTPMTPEQFRAVLPQLPEMCAHTDVTDRVCLECLAAAIRAAVAEERKQAKIRARRQRDLTAEMRRSGCCGAAERTDPEAPSALCALDPGHAGRHSWEQGRERGKA